METLIAVPRWVLFFGLLCVILTVLNVVVLVIFARVLGAEFIRELARRGADRVHECTDDEIAAKTIVSGSKRPPRPARLIVHLPAECAACATGVGHTAAELGERATAELGEREEKP